MSISVEDKVVFYFIWALIEEEQLVIYPVSLIVLDIITKANIRSGLVLQQH